jgi:hypothetical protein
MKIYESSPGMYLYKHLPLFARYILDHHLEEFVHDQIKYSREINIPLLNQLKQYSDEQLIQISLQSNQEYLTYLAANKAKEQLEVAFSRWMADQLSVISKFEISAEDITVFSFIRGKILKKWIRPYDIPLDD